MRGEGEGAAERSVCCTGGKERVQEAEPAAAVGSESEWKTAPSGCGRENPEAEAWASGGGWARGSGRERRVKGWDAALWG